MMDKYIEARKKAQEYFDSGYNCCEATVLAITEHFGVDQETALKIATPFGTGMSRNAGNCGVLSGAFIAIGMMRGRSANTEDREASYQPADRIYNKFNEKFGSVACRDIAKVDFRNPEEVANNKEKLHKVLCGPLLQEVVAWTIEELEKKEA